MKRVLIVEDELMIADILEEVLVQDGFDVCGIARTISAAIALAEAHKPELAIVDVHLADGSLGTDIAPMLISQYGTGILYTTANTDAIDQAKGHACLRKPFRLNEMRSALELVTQIIETGEIPSMTHPTPNLMVLSP